MTVEELIKELQQIENKKLPVYIWDIDQGELLHSVKSIDDCITDRIDLCI